jgi:hypothetical protein
MEVIMQVRKIVGMILFTGFFLSACASAADVNRQPDLDNSSIQDATSLPSVDDSQPTQEAIPTLPLLEDEPPPRGAEREFSTDFSKRTVSYREILSGGPPKDGIPAIDAPQFIDVSEADAWLNDVEPVVLVEVGDDARAYPIQILMWHEIVNDTVGGLPLVVTFCPLCNTDIILERTYQGQLLDFGTTGRLRFSNLIMYDRQTETWWQQATGEAIAGELAGARLTFYPGAMISWEEFKSSFTSGKVLSRETGFRRAYGNNPYLGYDDINNLPFLYSGPQTPGELPAVARVLTVDLNDEAVAYPYSVLENVRVVNDIVGGEPIVVFWTEGTASALDRDVIASGRDVGSAVGYSRVLDGMQLTFTIDGNLIKDKETGSEWNILGQAVAGELLGQQLSPVVAINHFWFSWAAFKPETRVYHP